MKFNSDPGWLKQQAALEDNCFVSVGGLVSAVEDLEQKSQQATASRTAFVNLLNLARREHKLTWEQFSQKLDVDLAELIEIENDESCKPTPRTVSKIANFLRVPAEKPFFVLFRVSSGHTTNSFRRPPCDLLVAPTPVRRCRRKSTRPIKNM